MAKLNDQSDYGFPDQAASWSEKKSMDYGKRVANFIEQEWFYKEGGIARFYDTRENFDVLRQYGRGDQDSSKYKKELAVDGDLSYYNLDWEPVPVIPKFVDLIVNGISDKVFDITAYAQDPISTLKRKDELDTLRAEMQHKQKLLQMQETSGVGMFENDPSTLPRDAEELDIYTQLHYKQKVEIAAETAIQQVLEQNRYDEIKRRISRDLVEVGMGAAKHVFDASKGIVIEYVDPANVVHSYTEDPNFSDIYYHGEIKRINIADLMQMFPDLTPDQLRQIRQSSASHYDTHGIKYNQIQNDRDDQREANKCEVLFFSWKTVRSEIHKIRENRKGGKTAVKRDESFEGPKTDDANFKKTQRMEEVVLSGVKVLGSEDLLLKWELEKNMVRPKSSTTEIVMPLMLVAPNYYKGRHDSMVKRITKYADMIQLTYLKIQQVIQKVVPPGIYVDADGLAEIDLGNGTSYNPREALNMFYQTGSIIGRSLTSEGDRNPGAVPIQELPGSQGVQLQSLIQTQAYWYDQIRLATGINEARDAADPDPRALVGVQKMLAANSNVCTRHILDGSLMITKKLAEAVSLRMQDILEYHPLAENFKMSIGKVNTGILRSLDGLHLHDFGIFLMLEPDEEEKQYLEQNIQQALSTQQIHLDDAIDVRGIKNLKLANQVLKIRRKRKFEEDQEIQSKQAEAQGQAQQQVAQAASQAKQQELQMAAQIDAQKLQTETQAHIQKLQAEMEFEKEILMLKHQLQMQILGSEQVHSTQENSKAQQADAKKEQVKGGGAGTGGIGLSSKSNTIDNKVKGSGYLQQ